MKTRLSKLLVIFCACLSLHGLGQPGTPVLRLETGGHISRIDRISTDSGAHFLLTCSEDKTARLWDRYSGRLLQTFRVPVNTIRIGSLYACALSPDGSLAAVGGVTGLDADESYCTYIFNTQTAEIIARLGGLDNFVSDITFSPDGRWLAVATEEGVGVYVYDVPGFRLAKKLTGISSTVVDIDFSSKGAFAILCLNSFLFVYDQAFTLKNSVKLQPASPHSIGFNPAGSELAIGYEDTVTVEVRDAETLMLKRSISMNETDVLENTTASVAISRDGSTLWAGGTQSAVNKTDGKRHVLRKWPDGGKGTYTDYPLFLNTITDLKPLPDGSVAVTTTQPEVAIIQPDGKAEWFNRAATNNYGSRAAKDFTINETGSKIGCRPVAKAPFLFDVNTRSVSDEIPALPGAVSQAGGTSVTNWYNSIHPVINSKPADFLKENDFCYSMDVSQDGKLVALGTNAHLCLADNAGEIIRKIPLPAYASAVNISGNGKVVATALGDGTIRWYRTSDGKELLAFFLHEDGKRWVVFTPSGFYDASPGAEEFLGWHLNNGPDKAPEFYPLSRFKTTYYRPALIDALFTTYDETKAIALAEAAGTKGSGGDLRKRLPPTITIFTPSNGAVVNSQEVTIEYKVNTAPGTSLKPLKVLVDGRPLLVDRGVKPITAARQQLKIQMPGKECTVTLLAENEYGFGPEARLFLRWNAGISQAKEFVILPTLYALVIGVSGYADPELTLHYAAKDANDFAACITRQKGHLYKDIQIKRLTDKEASRENILDGFAWLKKETTQHDIAMLFFAGHGISDDEDNFFMLPVDAKKDKLASSCVTAADLRQTIARIVGKVLVFIDACNSGNAMGNGKRGTPAFDINALANELSSVQNGAITFTSSTGNGFSREDDAWKNGAFTKALVEGLTGKAMVAESSAITVKSLDLYITNRVKSLTQGKQKPTTAYPPNIPDFPIAVLPE